MTSKTRQRLEDLKRQRERVEAQLETLSQQEIELQIEDDLRKSDEYKVLQRKITSLKARLHVIRVNLARKKYALETREEHIRKIREALTQFEHEETERAQELTECEEAVSALKQRLLKQASS